MAYEYLGRGALDYYPCHYGHSKLVFRGPKRKLNDGYCAVIGGSETFGKFIEQPYANLLEQMTGRKVINLGCMYAGADVFANDITILDMCAKADLTVIQLMGAQNMSNRFYSVHPRRNDRFVAATELLQSVYRELDFSEVHFTGHLLDLLQRTSRTRFEMVRKELQAEWVMRMLAIVRQIGGPVVLLWMSERAPGSEISNPDECIEPMFLNRDMIDAINTLCVGVVEIVTTPDEMAAGHDRMVFTPLDKPAVRQMLGPIAHQEAARKLLQYFRPA